MAGFEIKRTSCSESVEQAKSSIITMAKKSQRKRWNPIVKNQYMGLQVFCLKIFLFASFRFRSRFYILLFSWMVLFYHLGQVLSINVHIYFGGGNALMTQHLLDGTKIGPVFK